MSVSHKCIVKGDKGMKFVSDLLCKTEQNSSQRVCLSVCCMP